LLFILIYLCANDLNVLSEFFKIFMYIEIY